MNYGHIAPFYHLIEKLTMGHALQTTRMVHLERLRMCAEIQKALLVGEGDGSFLLSFMQRFPDAEITILEASEGMVRRAQARLNNAGLANDRITWIVSDLADYTFPNVLFDLIVTHFFFDNFSTELALEHYQKLACVARTDAHWLCADFQIPERGWRKWRAKFWLKILYLFFGMFAGLRVRQLPNYKVILDTGELECLEFEMFCGDMLYSGLYRLRAI